MIVKVGTPAPPFRAEGYCRGEEAAITVDLIAYRGRWVVLFFYPRDFTFVCPTELHAFAELEEAFAEEDAAVIAASTDSYWSHKAWFESHPLLADVAYPGKLSVFMTRHLKNPKSEARNSKQSTKFENYKTRMPKQRVSALCFLLI